MSYARHPRFIYALFVIGTLLSLLAPAQRMFADEPSALKIDYGQIQKYDPQQRGPNRFTFDLKDTRTDSRENGVNQVVMVGVIALKQSFTPVMEVTAPDGSKASCRGREKAENTLALMLFCEAQKDTQGTYTATVTDAQTGKAPNESYAVFVQETYGRDRITDEKSNPSLKAGTFLSYEYLRTGNSKEVTFTVRGKPDNSNFYGLIFDDKGNFVCRSNNDDKAVCKVDDSNVERYFVIAFNNTADTLIRIKLKAK